MCGVQGSSCHPYLPYHPYPHPCVGCLVTGLLSASVDDISASAAEICDTDSDMSIMSSD